MGSSSLFTVPFSVKVPLIYRPRNRPHLPMLPSDLPFMSTVKSSPEEWHEAICTIPMSRGSGLAPVECLVSKSFGCGINRTQLHDASSYLSPLRRLMLSQIQSRSIYRFVVVPRHSSCSLSMAKTGVIKVLLGNGTGEQPSEYICSDKPVSAYTENLPRRVTTSVRGKWNLHNPYLQVITHLYDILSGKAWTLSIGTEYLDVVKMSPLPASPPIKFPSRYDHLLELECTIYLTFLNTGFDRSVDRSSTTTQIPTARCKTLLSNTARDRSLVRRCR